MKDNKKIIEQIFTASLSSVYPDQLVKGYINNIVSYYSMKSFKRLIVTGFGKASYMMAKALEESDAMEFIDEGAVVTKYGHGSNGAVLQLNPSTDSSGQPAGLQKIHVYEAGHPIPDAKGILAADNIIRLVESADENTLVVCLISGGGSALFVSPCDGVTLGEKQEITDLLLRAGADIGELNAVRKHLSKVKGGRLAEIASPAEIISIMISDVIGDSLDVIASGPTAPDSSTYQDALDVIDKYDLAGRAPVSVMDHLRKGRQGVLPETPKDENPVFENVQNVIVGSNSIALEAAKKKAESLGMRTRIVTAALQGDAGEAAIKLAEEAKQEREKSTRVPTCLISGGETTVVVKGSGAGGRNTELALKFAMEIEGVSGITLLSAGTDGTDGPTDAAGAIVNGQTAATAKSRGLDPRAYLDRNDSYHFFKELNSLVITGPTGTNVMDVQIIIIDTDKLSYIGC